MLTLVEHLSAGHWSIQPSPNVAAANDNILLGVSCPTLGSCTAVGYTVANATVRALAEQWDGTTWTIEPTPIPAPGAWVELSGVSCPTSGACIAVGGYIKNSVIAQEQPLSETWNGSTWSLLPTPNPQAQNGSALSSVSCSSGVACTAGGDYAYADVDGSVFAFRWNGTTWTNQVQPNPQGQRLNSDNAVSCGAAAACTIVGSWVDNANNLRTLAQHWDGTAWVGLHPPNPVGSFSAQLYGVSCAVSSDCRAVGGWSGSPNGNPSVSLAEHWNGTQWSIDATPNPTGAQSSTLSAIDCRSPTGCVAVGNWSDGKVGRTLIEGYTG